MANEEKIIKFYSETISLFIGFVIRFYQIDILKKLNQNNVNLGVLYTLENKDFKLREGNC